MSDADDEGRPLDLLTRIGTRATTGERPTMTDRVDAALPPRADGPLPPRREMRPGLIGGDEPFAPPVVLRPLAPPVEADEEPKTAAIPSPRTPPGPGEIDLVVTPLPTPDDWHRFELALRRVRGVGQLRTEYYRHGVLKVRVGYNGAERLGTVIRNGVAGYRVRVIGEDRATLQILVSSEPDTRRSS